MSKKKSKRQVTASEIYALCVTIGLVVGLGLSPLMGNILMMAGIGAVAGALLAFLVTRRSAQQRSRRHH